MNSKALFNLSYGLYLASSKYENKMNGCIVNTVMQVTDSPNQIMMAVNKNNMTCDIIKNSRNFAVSVLSESTPFKTFEQFGFRSGKDYDKFMDVPFKMTKQELPYLTENTTAFIDLKTVETIDLKTHLLFLGLVVDCEILSSQKPMTYAYYHEFVKPKPAAPKTTGWRCRVCGYVHEGEELPPDYVCPVCKHGADAFDKI